MNELPTIVVVDDARDIRLLVRALLRRHASIVECDSRASARQAVAERSPEVVFIDLMLGDECGYALHAELRALGSRGRHVALSACDSAEDIARIRAARFDEHLVKPVRRDELFRAAGIRST